MNNADGSSCILRGGVGALYGNHQFYLYVVFDTWAAGVGGRGCALALETVYQEPESYPHWSEMMLP